MRTGKKKNSTERIPAATAVRVTARELILNLKDGRKLSIPIEFYPTLVGATPRQRAQSELIGEGRAIVWEDLDLHLSVEALLQGFREGIPKPPPLHQLVAPKLAQRRRSA